VNCCSSVDEQLTVADATVEIRRQPGVRRDRRGRLLRGYLHKSSNSLCGIKGYASLIAGGPGTTGRGTAWARKIIAEVERLEDIYRSVREMAFPVPAPSLGTHALGPVLADACDAAAGRHANLRVGPTPPLSGDLLLPAGDLLQVLTAVLDNSAESREEPVEITVSVGPGEGERLVLMIADDGPGMPRELLVQAVDPFVTTRAGRLGIGLARVDTIMDMHGLGWGLRSVPGQGTTVTLEVARPRGGNGRPSV
jgi:two-component system sensor histidine kinase HydH